MPFQPRNLQRIVFSYACLSHDICYVGSTSGTEWLIDLASALGSSTSVIWATCHCSDVWTNKQDQATWKSRGCACLNSSQKTLWHRVARKGADDAEEFPQCPSFNLTSLIHASINPHINQSSNSFYYIELDNGWSSYDTAPSHPNASRHRTCDCYSELQSFKCELSISILTVFIRSLFSDTFDDQP